MLYKDKLDKMHSFAILGYNKKALITDVINQLEELKNLGYSHIKLRVLKIEDYDYGLGYLLKSQAFSFRKETQEEYKARLEQQKLEEARKQDIEYQEYLHYRDKYLTLKEKFD